MNYGTIYGKLGRVGVATPFGGEVVIQDFYRYLHKDIQVAEVQIPLGRLTPEGLKEMSDQLEREMSLFPQYCPIDLALFSCTSGSQVGGKGYDAYLCEVLQKASGARMAYTTTTAIIKALQTLGSKRISIVTPYPDDVNAMEKAYFENEGFLINSIKGMITDNPRDPMLIPKIEPEETYKFALKHVDPQSDTLFISCCGLTTFEVIDPLEKKLSIPVITSNQCAAWVVGKFFGYHGPESYRLGTLFSK